MHGRDVRAHLRVLLLPPRAGAQRQGAPTAQFVRRLTRLPSQERKLFDERFVKLDTRRLCELTSAADALGAKTLVDLTSRALARLIEGKSPEEIRETFNLPDDLTGARSVGLG